METTVVQVAGMTCGHCTSSVEQALNELPGVSSVTADLDSGTVTIEQDGSVSSDAIATVVEDIGFELA